MPKLVLAAVVVAALAVGAWAAFGRNSVDHGHAITVGALEDGVKWPQPQIADQRVALGSDVGFNALDVTSAWSPDQAAPAPDELKILRNVAAATDKRHIQLLITVYAARPRDAPVSDGLQQRYAAYVASLAKTLPTVHAYAVWNEPNLNGFWLYQYSGAGKDIAAPAYTALLARTYDALKAVSSQNKVYGGNLAPRGFDNPQSGRPTHSPTTFIRDMGIAYRASGRTKPIMDVFALHPYMTRSAIPPTTPHTGTSLGFGDYDKLVALLGTAFDGTAQPGSKLPIAYTEFGVQSIIPPAKQGPYTNLQSPFGRDAVPESTQADYYKQAFKAAACQKNAVAVYIFHLIDEADLNRWQSGPFYADATPKSNVGAIKSAAEKARDGKLANCS